MICLVLFCINIKKAKNAKETSKKTTTDFNPSCFGTEKKTIEPKLALLLLFAHLEHVIVPKSKDMDNLTEDLKYQN